MWTRSTTCWLAYLLLVLNNFGYLGVQLRRFGVHQGGLEKHKGGLRKVRWIRLGWGTVDWTEVPWSWLERVGMLRYLKLHWGNVW